MPAGRKTAITASAIGGIAVLLKEIPEMESVGGGGTRSGFASGDVSYRLDVAGCSAGRKSARKLSVLSVFLRLGSFRWFSGDRKLLGDEARHGHGEESMSFTLVGNGWRRPEVAGKQLRCL